MNFSYNWLKELVEDLNAPPRELTSLITIKTAECEGVHSYAPWLENVRAVRVETAEAIEGSRNVKATVDTGQNGRKTVVCGAPNCRTGLVTAYISAGVTLGKQQIGEAVIDGVRSEGMLASGAELGVNRDAEGILELALQPGDSLDLEPDNIIEVDNKSLTHRPDLWGHHGMAREIAAITGKTLRDPVDPDLLPPGDGAVPVRVEDFDLCRRYSALLFENVTVQPSPLWLQYRLEAIGLNPINNIVDVTNYVMAEIAQPMHAFDADKLRGGIAVRLASDGESIAALNGETYTLTRSNLVIADQAGAIAIAGVIGGAESAIGAVTTRIVLESANFHASSVRRTAAGLKLRTDASMRFEKSQDPANTVRGLARAVALLKEVSPGIRVVGGVTDAYQPAPAATPIEVPLEWLRSKIGRHIENWEVRDILRALGFDVDEIRPKVLSIGVPGWRATGDISIREDLVEEVGRMIGYASIPPAAPSLPVSVPPANEVRRHLYTIRRLVAAQGFDEVYNYSFVSPETMQMFGLSAEEHVRVLNPIAAGQTHLRASLVPGIWKNIVENAKYFDEFRIFEVGREFRRKAGSELPMEVNHLVAAAYRKSGDTEDLFELKRLAECLNGTFYVRPAVARLHEHPARAAELILHGESAGRLFELHPSLIERGRAAVLDVDLDALVRLSQSEQLYTPIRRFPSSAFDLSVIAPARALVGELQRELSHFAGGELETIEYVRQYSGPPLPEGSKSVSYRVTVGSPNRTISSDETSSIRQHMIDGMRSLGYDLRV